MEGWLTMKYVLATALAMFLWLGLARSPAFAALRVCNDSQQKVFVASAVMTMESACPNAICHKSDGWYNIEPGECTIVVRGDLNTDIGPSGTSYYVYADDGYSGHKWNGSTQFCVDPAEGFHYTDSEPHGCRAAPGFWHIRTYYQRDYTLHLFLTPPKTFSMDSYTTMNGMLDTCASDASPCLAAIYREIAAEASRFCVEAGSEYATVQVLNWLRENRYSSTTSGDTFGNLYPLRAIRSAIGNIWGEKGTKC